MARLESWGLSSPDDDIGDSMRFLLVLLSLTYTVVVVKQSRLTSCVGHLVGTLEREAWLSYTYQNGVGGQPTDIIQYVWPKRRLIIQVGNRLARRFGMC